MNTSVAFFMPSLSGGGAERMMVNLANAFASRGIRTDLVLVRAVGPYRDEVSSDVNVIDLGVSRILASVPGLVRYLQVHRPETMLSTLTFANVVAAWVCQWVRCPPRLVLREANTVSAISRQSSGLKNRLIPHLIRWFYPWADRVVAVSEAAGDDLIRTTGVPPDLVTTIYNPVVTDELLEKAREPLDHPWFVEDAPPVILGVGRQEPQKDFETLIRAFHRVRIKREARLVILGKGDERPSLERLVQSLGLESDICMPGFVDNPFKYMAQADVFVLSSRFEGLPGVLIQAMATGCPVVSTDCPSGPREILEGGRWGTLVPVGSEGEMASAVLKTLDQPLHSDRLRDRAQAFSASKAVDQYLDVLLG